MTATPRRLGQEGRYGAGEVHDVLLFLQLPGTTDTFVVVQPMNIIVHPDDLHADLSQGLKLGLSSVSN